MKERQKRGEERESEREKRKERDEKVVVMLLLLMLLRMWLRMLLLFGRHEHGYSTPTAIIKIQWPMLLSLGSMPFQSLSRLAERMPSQQGGNRAEVPMVALPRYQPAFMLPTLPTLPTWLPAAMAMLEQQLDSKHSLMWDTYLVGAQLLPNCVLSNALSNALGQARPLPLG